MTSTQRAARGSALLLCLAFMASGAVGAEAIAVKISASGPYHVGAPIVVRVSYTNPSPNPIIVRYPKQSSPYVWAVNHAPDLTLAKQGAYTQRPRPPRERLLDASATARLAPDRSVSFEFDLRSVFSFHAPEKGDYAVSLHGSSARFRIVDDPNIVLSDTAPSGTPPGGIHYSYEYAVRKTDTNAYVLMARRLPQAFRQIYELQFVPSSLKCLKIENAPRCREGVLVVLGSPKGAHVLSPGQAYDGQVRGDRGPIAVLSVGHVAGIGELRYVGNSQARTIDFSVSLVLSPNDRGQANAFFRLQNHRIREISEEEFSATLRTKPPTPSSPDVRPEPPMRTGGDRVFSDAERERIRERIRQEHQRHERQVAEEERHRIRRDEIAQLFAKAREEERSGKYAAALLGYEELIELDRESAQAAEALRRAGALKMKLECEADALADHKARLKRRLLLEAEAAAREGDVARLKMLSRRLDDEFSDSQEAERARQLLEGCAEATADLQKRERKGQPDVSAATTGSRGWPWYVLPPLCIVGLVGAAYAVLRQRRRPGDS